MWLNRLKPAHLKWGTVGLLFGGMVAGVVLWGGFNTVMEATNSLEFCTSCHEMRDTVFQEYKKSIHYKNASGVRAICSDCHVPKDWTHKIIRKIQASKEIYHKLIGTIDTPEKFEEHRLTLAKSVWATMKATDSRECRNCHSFETMDFHKQRPEAAKQMSKAMNEGATCIDCHKGIAHKKPDMSTGFRTLFNDLVADSAKLSPKPGDTLYTLTTIDFSSAKPNGDAGPSAGRVLAATPVKVLARDGDFLNVRISGWQQQGAERMLYEQAGKRIFVAALGPAAVKNVQSGETVTNAETSQVWTAGTLDVWIPNKNLADDINKIWAYGSEMFGATCNACHAAPAIEHFAANQWIGTLSAMKNQISLDDEQYRLLQKYLQMNTTDTKGATVKH